MSGSRIKLNWIHAVGQSNLPTITKAVAYGLGAFMNGHGETFVSAETVATYASVSERTARRHLLHLESGGFLRVERRKGFTSRYFAVALTPDTVLTGVRKQTPDRGRANPGHSSDRNPGNSSDLRNGFEIEINGSGNGSMTKLKLPQFVRQQMERDEEELVKEVAS